MEPPSIIHMCFASPVNIRDLDKGGDFAFGVLRPDGRRLGLRIVFQPDGFGVDIHPGLPEDPPAGQWTFEWRVTDPETLEPAEGTVSFTVSPGGSPVPEEPPSRCPARALPSTVGVEATPTPATGATPSPTPASGEDEADDDQDILLLALITTGSIIGAAVLGLILYLVRRRIGFWLH